MRKKCQTASVDTLGNRTPMPEGRILLQPNAKYPLNLADNKNFLIKAYITIIHIPVNSILQYIYPKHLTSTNVLWILCSFYEHIHSFVFPEVPRREGTLAPPLNLPLMWIMIYYCIVQSMKCCDNYAQVVKLTRLHLEGSNFVQLLYKWLIQEWEYIEVSITQGAYYRWCRCSMILTC